MTEFISGNSDDEERVLRFGLSSKQKAYLTGLALLDETTLGSQVRNAIDLYAVAPHEFSAADEDASPASLPHPVEMRYRKNETARMLGFVIDAADAGVSLNTAVSVVLEHYVTSRLEDPSLAEQVEAAINHA